MSYDIDTLLGSTLQNLLYSYLDTFIEANTKLGYEVGMNEKIVRTCIGAKNCKWCLSLQGTYKYPDEVPKDVWRRHVNCDCVITHVSDRGAQNVHSKKMMSNKDINKLKDVKQKELLLARDNRIAQALQIEKANDIIYSGARILNPESEEATDFAEKYYGQIRKMSTDMIKISKNTEYTVDEISKIKNYLFFNPGFDYDCAIAQSWQRLMLNDNIKEHDLLLLKHELYEMDLKKKYPKMTHSEAHAQASYKYNYSALSKEYYGNLKKRNKNK